MPSGRTHDRITFWSLPLLVGFTYLFSGNRRLTLLIAGSYLFSGLMFGPDLDIHSIQYKRWGIIRGMWLPYRYLIKHRSLFSHGFLIGTILRLLYLLTILMLVAIIGIVIVQLIWRFDWSLQQFIHKVIQLMITRYSQEVIILGIGLELGAMSHTISDYIKSAIKKHQRQTQKRTKNKKNSRRRRSSGSGRSKVK
ncbi:metal-binding protein [cyanobacterium endosymbiont of Epithemia clementina EcSB]|uniref:metal-binding protein n=1 Tax=cyanobacterium endosymbiont of Epithemia clementina EcSB TaxID=3034674 RepID=UPI00247FD6AE|nr:metal-binding protein [cyanobacterium endosymbiont of Epithemia clementina EcSB]WGT67007.1 metal-binding protein [cyanobacterium endosymbiont of Epithemia clementina EcSB]